MATLLGEYGEVEIRHSNNNGNYAIKNGTLLEGQNLAKGTLLGIIASGDDAGKLVAYNEAGTDDGRRTAVGILKQSVDATDEDTECGYYTQGGFQESRLTAPDTGWRADLNAVRNTSIDCVTIYA
jgi:hypothetical protein